MLLAAVLAAALLHAAPVSAQSIPESVTIPLTTREGETFPNVVSISVGGGPASPVTFDTGSPGLYILPKAVGSYVPTGSTFIQGYEDHNLFSGPVVLSTVSFAQASGPATTGAIGVGLITDARCASGFSCPGMGEGRVGVLGARYYNGAADNVFNPLAFLPGNLSSGFIVAATGPTPSVIVGLTPAMLQPFVSSDATRFTPEFTAGQGGATRAWETKSISVCFSVNGGTAGCDATSFDTGEFTAQFVPGAPVDPKLINAKGNLVPGQQVTITIPGILIQTVTTGETDWLDKYKILSAPEGSPPGFNSGAQFFYYYAVSFDYVHGIGGFSPLTTWITGSYTAANDSDLGKPGAIALFGKLTLADGFSSARPIFIASDSTFKIDGVTTLSGTLSGASPLTIEGNGVLTLSGQSANTAPVLVDGPSVMIDGSLPTVVVLADGLLGGNGSLGALVAGGGVVAPGHSIGKLTVTGDAVFGADAVYRAEIGAGGRSDLIAAGGKTTIAGATLEVVADQASLPGIGAYTVLTSAGGISGAFDVLAPDFGTPGASFPFLSVDAETSGNAVTVEVGRSDVPFSLFAETANQRAAASGADRLGVSSPLLQALASLDGASTPPALDAISGEIYASDQTVLVEQSGYVRDAVLGRLRQISDGVTAPKVPLYAWGQGYGGFGSNDGNLNVGSVSNAIGGFIAGFDARIAPNWRAGVATGGGQSNFDLDARRSWGDTNNVDLAAYSGVELGTAGPGALALRLGGAYSWHDIETNRQVSFPGLFDSVSTSYAARTGQAFGEIGYALGHGGAVQFEPVAGVSFANLDSDSFSERGGAAVLHGESESFSSTDSVLGLRASNSFVLSNGSALRLRGQLGWVHAFGDLVPSQAIAFSGETTPFVVTGVSLAEDSLAVGGTIELAMSELSKLSLSYAGEFANSVEANSVQGAFSVRF